MGPDGAGDWLRRVLDASGEWVWETDREGRHTASSPTVEGLLGWTVAQVVGGEAGALVDPDDRARAAELRAGAVAGRRGWSGVVLRWRHRAGGVRWLESTAEPVLDAAGEVAGFRGVDRDVTVRVRTEKVLREAFSLAANERARVESILGALAEGISIQDRDYRVLYQNPAHVAFAGSHKGERCFRAYERRDAVCPGCPIAATFADGGVHGVTRTVGDGEGQRVFDIVTAPLRDAAGALVAGIETVREVTAQRRTAAALARSEERFRELADTLPETVFETDATGLITYANRTGLDAFGYAPDDIARGVTIAELIAPEDRATAAANFAARMRGERVPGPEYRALRRDGTTFPAILHAHPILEGGRPAGLRGVVIDVTERKVLETERLRAEKLASIGILAGGIAHDFNNILTAILGNISLLRTRLAGDGAAVQRIEEAEKASLQARDLTQQLLTFARGGAPVREPIRVGRVVEDAARLALRGASSRLELSLPADLPPVEADAGQIAQVVQNLVLNAAQAMPSGGTVTVGADLADVGPGGGLPLAAGRYVRIWVSDSGAGIPAEHLPRIFDPYFTTKPRGTGLGLAVAYSVVQAHGGHLEVESAPALGSTFSVYLPPTDREPRDPAEEREAPAARGAARVLVMDDDPMVREVAEAILVESGFETRCVTDGLEAVGLYREALAAGKPFDVVVMDLTIPGGVGGVEALRRLREIDPDVRAVVSSGYSNDPVMADHARHGFRGVATKPYRARDLTEAVLAAIAAPAGRG